MSVSHGGTKRRKYKAWIRASERIHNLVDECHKKITKWLFDTFQTLIIPKLDFNQFSSKKTSKMVKNKMKLWRHCSFINRLKDKQRLYPSTRLIIPQEDYTTMTCSSCGCLHRKIGRSKTYICQNNKCQKIFDRDVNSGKNILLKLLTETTSVVL